MKCSKLTKKCILTNTYPLSTHLGVYNGLTNFAEEVDASSEAGHVHPHSEALRLKDTCRYRVSD